jgi:YVTN family beta-propeller protein
VTKNLLLFALFSLVLAGCQFPVQKVKPVLEDEGVTYLYVRPFPREAERLRFTLEAAAAIRSDGVEIPLQLRLAELNGTEMSRQRLLAVGPLPPGTYQGFSFKVKSASLKGEEGEAALLLPKEPARVDFAFVVKKNRALLVSLAFDYEKSLKGEVQFTPAFSASMPGKPPSGLAGYVTNYGSDTITVFDKKAREAVDVIQTGRGPAGIVVDQRQRRAYAVLSGEDAIEVIDVAAGAAINRIMLSPGDAPRDAALTPDGRTLITANTGSDTVSIIDPISLLEVARINLDNRPGQTTFGNNRPGSVLIDRTGRRAYIFNTLANNIIVLDIPNRALLPTAITTDSAPVRGDFSRKGDRLMVYQEWSPYFLVFDTASFAHLKRIDSGMGIGWFKVDTATDLLYVGKKQEGTVDIYDPFSFVPGDSIDAAGGVSFMTIDGEENNLYAIVPEKKRLQIFSLVSKKVVGEIDLDDRPYWAAVIGER